MRNIKHHIIVITGHDLEELMSLRSSLLELAKINVEASNGNKMIGEAVETLINNYYTMVLYPDGSKEGHETSDDCDILREKIVVHLKSYKKTAPESSLNFVEISFGDDLGKASLLNFG